MRFYEDEPVYRSALDDIDMEFVAKYCEKIGYGKTPEEYIRQNKDYIVNVAGRQEMSGAASMMFGKDPQRFFQGQEYVLYAMKVQRQKSVQR